MNISTSFSYVVLVYGGNHVFRVNLFNSVCKEFEIQKAKVNPPLNVKYRMKLKFLREKLSGTKQSFARKKTIHIQKAPDEKNLTEWNEKPKNSKEDETVWTMKSEKTQMLVENEKKESLKRRKTSKDQNMASMLRISDQINPEPEE